MLNVKALKTFTEENKTVLIRFDLNIPLNEESSAISDRIIRIKNPIHNLHSKKNKVIILSHLGRPKGKKDEMKETELTPRELKRREEIAKKLDLKDFEKRYGKDKGMNVKMAVATKMAKKESKDQETDESGIMYRAGVKKYGKDGMKKIQSAAGKGASAEEIGKIK